MSLQLRQNLKLAQQLIMTPQLQQAIKLLQLSRLELVETVQQALLENPVLEERGPETDPDAEQQQSSESQSEKVREFDVQEQSLLRSAEWDDYLGNFSSTSRQASERELPEEMASFETMHAAKPTLESHLLWQLHLSNLSDRQKEIGEVIVGSLDSHGYLHSSTEDIGFMCQASPEEVADVLPIVQRFDPVGVASSSLAECLQVQVDFLGKDDPILSSLIQDHLEDIESGNLQALAKKFHVAREDIEAYVRIIQSLDPRPGSSFGGGETFYISPDAYVYAYGDEFVIVLNDEGFPDLQISPYYAPLLESKDSHQGKQYLQDQMRQGLWLLKSIQQRQRTLYKVLESIVRFQREFFIHGVSQLKPLVLKDVADEIEVHESTVSRITTNKYVATPFGIFELKYFFNSGLGTSSGEQVASESVKAAIKNLISHEDQKKPWSDKQLVECLNKELQVNIARRTVAKYRESLGIPSSTKRKRKVR
ncbi:RNA polymerase factor sigma-54 [Desulfovermiculus halophilus]|jgi:RNA polymerase sigma-54 factor|uniref:RNA polymerase factor sigma-54 n=1 Tax=Desulfovermiculus halophilus TaxID=339722 RepID=UPI00048625E3|nr:RNA polymerase factor sigma-54 [Desulfovermiculus halophilus]